MLVCDRCEAKSDKISVRSVYIGHPDKIEKSFEYELCKTCRRKLIKVCEKFMKKEKEVKA